QGLYLKPQESLARPRGRCIKNAARRHAYALPNDGQQHCREHYAASYVVHKWKLGEWPPDDFCRLRQLRLCRHAWYPRPISRQEVQTCSSVVANTIKDRTVGSHSGSSDDSSQRPQYSVHALCCNAAPKPFRRIAAFFDLLFAHLAHADEVYVAIEIIKKPI